MAERAYRVHGRVQGVGFRWWTRSRAEHLGVDGSVRNEPDGTVLVRARGSEQALGALEENLRHGPPGARVERIEVETSSGSPRAGFH